MNIFAKIVIASEKIECVQKRSKEEKKIEKVEKVLLIAAIKTS